MAIPLTHSAEALASQAATATPHFAAALMSADNKNSPIMVDSHLARVDASAMATHISPVMKWATNAARAAVLGAAMLGGTDIAEQALKATQTAYPGATQKVMDIYNRIMGRDNASAETLLQGEHVKPQSRHAAEDTPERRNYETTMLTSSIVGVGFGEQVDRISDKGAFDAHIFKQVNAAAAVIAPGKLLSAMSETELGAVTTSVIQASQDAFLKQMRIQEPEAFRNSTDFSRKVVEVSASTVSAEQVARSFMKDGKFSEELFNKRTTEGANIGPAQAAANSTQMASLLMNNSMQKAADSVAATNFDAIGKDRSARAPIEQWSIKNTMAVRTSLQAREDRLEMTNRPQEVERAPSI